MIGFNALGQLGRLGNQMFQFAALKGIARHHDYQFCFPPSANKNEWTDHQLLIPFKMSSTNALNIQYIDPKRPTVAEKGFGYDNDLFLNCPDWVSIQGFFQTEKYFKDIRKTSSQADLVNKIPKYVSLFSAHGMLETASLMIYDKIKIVQPKPDYIDNASGICLVFILNDDPEKCNEWVSQLNLNSNTLELSKAKFYLSLANGKAIKETNLNQLIDYEGFSDRQKNIIVKYYELITNSKKISYWKTPNELNKVSSITANIKLHNYFESLENQIGEKIILLNILHGDDNFNENDEFSIFLIIDSLFEINKAYAQDYILEYFSTYNL